MKWLKVANIGALVFVFGFGGYKLLAPFIAASVWSEDYKDLMYECDHAMKDHYIAKKATEVFPNAQTVKNLQASELSLMICHDYDKLRKTMLSFGLNSNDLSMIGLETMEEKSYDLNSFVQIHEVRY